ncbi:MAG: hypothetical protein ACRDS1_15095 [Pseudonocardiaceae bacterium]
MALSSLLPDIPGTVVAGLAGVLYLLLISVTALAAIFAKRKSRRDVAKEVLGMLLPGRRRDR